MSGRRPRYHVRQYGPHSWAVYNEAGICQSFPSSRAFAVRLAESRNRFERLNLESEKASAQQP